MSKWIVYEKDTSLQSHPFKNTSTNPQTAQKHIREGGTRIAKVSSVEHPPTLNDTRKKMFYD
jgi:hypothetical protein